MNHIGFCRTAPATPGLLIIGLKCKFNDRVGVAKRQKEWQKPQDPSVQIFGQEMDGSYEGFRITQVLLEDSTFIEAGKNKHRGN